MTLRGGVYETKFHGDGSGGEACQWSSGGFVGVRVCTRAFESPFKELGVQPDRQGLQFSVGFGPSYQGNLVFEFFLQVEVELVRQGSIVPMHILLLGFKFGSVLCC